MSLKDPTSKMSKSDTDVRSRILVTDTAEEIHRKLKGALTDSEPRITYDPIRRPGVSNLVEILSYFEGKPCDEVVLDLQDSSLRALKEHVASSISSHLQPIREKYIFLMEDKTDYVEAIENQGALAARSNAEQTMTQVKNALGL